MSNDVHSASTRSFNMSQIRSKNTKPELIVRKLLFSLGFRFRLHDKNLPGTPDVVLKKYRCVIFIHGCFWHGHKYCKYASLPKTRQDFWRNKINRNSELDSINHSKLKLAGWNVVEIFQCELKPDVILNTTERILKHISNVNL